MNSFYLFAFASAASAIVPIAVKTFITRKEFSVYDVLIVLSFISIATDAVCFIYSQNKTNNWPFINLFLIFQVLILFFVLYQYNKRNWAFVFLIFFICFAGYNYYWFYDQISMHTATNYIGSAFLIAFAFDCIDKIMVELPVENIYDHPIYWICCSVFLYFTGNFFPFLFNNQYLELNLMDMRAHWVIHNFLNICKNVCFALALWMNYRMRLS